MTFAQAKNDYVIFKVFKRVKNKKDKWIEEEIESSNWKNIPDKTQGKIAICNANDYGVLIPVERLCFLINEEELK